MIVTETTKQQKNRFYLQKYLGHPPTLTNPNNVTFTSPAVFAHAKSSYIYFKTNTSFPKKWLKKNKQKLIN